MAKLISFSSSSDDKSSAAFINAEKRCDLNNRDTAGRLVAEFGTPLKSIRLLSWITAFPNDKRDGLIALENIPLIVTIDENEKIAASQDSVVYDLCAFLLKLPPIFREEIRLVLNAAEGPVTALESPQNAPQRHSEG